MPAAGPRSALREALLAATGPVPTMTAAWLAAFLLSFFESHVHAVLIGLGFIGALVAGLVGVGGAIIMIPLLLYVPPLVGLPAFGIHTVSGATMVQVAAAGLSGTLGHIHQHGIQPRLIVTLGGGMAAGSLLGALASSHVSARALAAVFASLALFAATVMFLPRSPAADERTPTPVRVSARLALGGGACVGFFVGMVGAGGGFLLVPLMLYVLRLPLRAAVGTSLGIVTVSAIAGSLGKAFTAQVDWFMALALVTGALPGARLGATISQRVRTETLSLILGILISLVAVLMWWEILGE